MRTRHHWRLSRHADGDQLMTYLMHFPEGPRREVGPPGYYLVVTLVRRGLKMRLCSGPIPALKAAGVAQAAQEDHGTLRDYATMVIDRIGLEAVPGKHSITLH